MLLRQICLFMLLAISMEGIALNENMTEFKTMGNTGQKTALNICQNTNKCNDFVINSNGKITSVSISNKLTPRMVGSDKGSALGAMAWQTLAQQVTRCHFVLLTPDTQNTLVSHIIRYSTMASQALVVVDVSRFKQTTSERLAMALWGGTTTTCRALFIDLTTDGITDLFRFLEASRFWVWSESWVVLVGSKLQAQEALQHKALRNVLRPIFLGLQDVTLQDLTIQSLTLKNDKKLAEIMNITVNKVSREVVTVFSRCLYCNKGEPMVRFLFLWPVGSTLPQHLNPFTDQLDDLQGCLMHVVSVPHFPYVDYKLDTDEPATTVTLLDSIDKRLLKAFSAHLNFTYEVRAPWDMQFGLPTSSGNWSGMVGTIQYNKADFTTYHAPNAERLAIMDPVRAYGTDYFAIVSLKPTVLPRYLIIIRPFTVDVWLYLMLFVMIWATNLWVLQNAWSHFTGKPRITLSAAVFYSWAVILEDPPPKPPTNSTGQMLVGWWLVACLVISTGYKSSLVTNLAKESMTSPIDNLQDLVEQVNWKWSAEKVFLTGYPLRYFQTTKDPLVQQIHKRMEYVNGNAAGLNKVLKGGYSYFAVNKLIKTEIASYYTNNVGETPYYISRHGLAMFPDFSWGFRKGAPYRNRMNHMMIRLQEAGITQYWDQDVMASRVRKNRQKAKQEDSVQKIQVQQMSDNDQVVLRMSHMLGVFLTLMLGFAVAFCGLLAERIIHKWNN